MCHYHRLLYSFLQLMSCNTNGLWCLNTSYGSPFTYLSIKESVFLGFPGNSADKESAYNSGDSGLGRSPEEGIGYPLQYSWASLVAQLVKNPIPGLGGSHGERNSYLLQYPGLENSTGWIVHGVAKSQTRLSLWNNNGGLWTQKTLILKLKFELCFWHSLAI